MGGLLSADHKDDSGRFSDVAAAPRRVEEAQSPVLASETERPATSVQRLEAKQGEEAQIAQRVADLLARAERQVAAKSLTTPIGHSAHETYQEVLRLAPGHAGALEGIKRIKSTYRIWADAARQHGDWHLAERDLLKALAIDPEDSSLKQALRELKEARPGEENARRGAEKAALQIVEADTQAQIPASDTTSKVTEIAWVVHEIVDMGNPQGLLFVLESLGP